MLSTYMRSNQNVPTRPVRGFLIGPSRSGKTSIAVSFPNPVLISAQHEGGARIVDNLPFHVGTIECSGFLPGKGVGGLPSLMDVTNWMAGEARNGTLRRADGSFVGTIIPDSLSHFESMLISEVCGPSGKMEKQHWGVLLDAWKTWRAALWGINAHIVMTCLDEVKTTATGQIIGHTSALKGQIGGLLPSECDFIGYTEQEQDGVFMTYLCRRGLFTGGTRIRGMANGSYRNFTYGAHIAPHLGG